MLDRLGMKIQGTELQDRICLYKCEANQIGLSEKVDFILAFYMLHEVPDQEGFFTEIAEILKIKGRVFIAEPPFHVSKSAFEKTMRKAQNAGFVLAERPKVFLSKTAVLKKD
jgi:ubiquinone/menaquinone biosynthesis C-methylase UbiE